MGHGSTANILQLLQLKELCICSSFSGHAAGDRLHLIFTLPLSTMRRPEWLRMLFWVPQTQPSSRVHTTYQDDHDRTMLRHVAIEEQANDLNSKKPNLEALMMHPL